MSNGNCRSPEKCCDKISKTELELLAEICKAMVDDLSPSIHTLTIGYIVGNRLINLLLSQQCFVNVLW